MYNIVVRHQGQPAQSTRRCTADQVRDAAFGMVRAEGSEISAQDEAGIAGLVTNARAVADADGFAALEFGKAWMTIRPT